MKITVTPIGADPLTPYVPRLVVDWLANTADARHARDEGSLVFADISGFTALTERLAIRGKAGAEEMGELVNGIFDELLTAAYNYGANLLKWGGDAVLLLFEHAEHAPRAVRAAWAMQQVMRRIGRLHTSCGIVRLGMSIGIASGPIEFLLVGSEFRELVVLGPTASMSARMEAVASRRDVVMSAGTARLVRQHCVGEPVADGAGALLARPPDAPLNPNRSPKPMGVDLGAAVCRQLRHELRAGRIEHEHRAITVGFIGISGTDELLAAAGAEVLTAAVDEVMSRVQAVADAHEVAVLSTDVAENGCKIILSAGAPAATGEDETRMLATLRQAVRGEGPLRMRAGVACGGVFAGDYGPFYRRTYSVTGDAVNLAARLMGRAEPGGVIATQTVVARSRTRFETTALEPFAVKGKRLPVEALSLGEMRVNDERSPGERTPLIGRERELAILLEAVRNAEAGAGEVVDIVGAPGIGKTRLVAELAEHTAARLLRADGDIYGRVTPYRPLQQMLRQSLEVGDDVDGERMPEILADFVAASAPDLLPWLPLVGVAAGIELPPTPEVEQLEPEMRRAKLEAVTCDLLGRLLTGPHLLLFNDVQFMDDATIGLLKRLSADIAARPWLIVTTRRPETLSAAPAAATITLTPLTRSAAEELAAAAVEDTPLPPHRMRQLVQRADGNPLFLHQLVAGALAGADLEELPDSIEGVIAARIDRLPPRRRRWLRAASVLGMIVDPHTFGELVADTDLADDDSTGLEEFIAPGLDGQLHFVHHLIRLSAYEGLPFRRRTELHVRAAEVLERTEHVRPEALAPLLSLHCLRGERYEAAWRYSRLAGDQARQSYASVEAAECYRRAVSAADHVAGLRSADVADVLEALGDVSLDLGELPSAETAYRSARARATNDPVRHARLCLKTSKHRELAGRYGNALTWITSGRALVRGRSERAAKRLLAELAERAAMIRYNQGAYANAMAWAKRAVAEAKRARDPLIETRCLGVVAVLGALRGLPWDESTVRASLQRLADIGDQRGHARACNTFGMCAYFAGRWDLALDLYAQAEVGFVSMGFEHEAAAAVVNRAEVLVQQGRAEEAEPLLARAARVQAAAEATMYLGFTMSLWGWAASLRGDLTTALERFGEARALCLAVGATDDALTVDALAAEALLLAGDSENAIRLVDAALERTRTLGGQASAQPLLHRVRGTVLIIRGALDEGAAELRRSLAEARKRNAAHAVNAALQALVLHHVADNDDERGAWQAEMEELARDLGIIVQRSRF